MLMATNVGEPVALLFTTDCADHGSSNPLVNMTCEVARCSDATPWSIPNCCGLCFGCGVTPNNDRHQSEVPSNAVTSLEESARSAET